MASKAYILNDQAEKGERRIACGLLFYYRTPPPAFLNWSPNRAATGEYESLQLLQHDDRPIPNSSFTLFVMHGTFGSPDIFPLACHDHRENQTANDVQERRSSGSRAWFTSFRL